MNRDLLRNIFRISVPVLIIGFGAYVVIGKIRIDKEHQRSQQTVQTDRRAEIVRTIRMPDRKIITSSERITRQTQTPILQSDENFKETLQQIIEIEARHFRDYPGFFEAEVLEGRILQIILISDKPSLSPAAIKQSQTNAKAMFRKLICRHKSFKRLADLRLNEDSAVYAEIIQKGSLGHQMWEISVKPEDCVQPLNPQPSEQPADLQ
jgi:hypothetical protein